MSNTAAITDTTCDLESATVVRSKLYQLFALAITYPDSEWVAAVKAGELADTLTGLLGRLDEDLLREIDRNALCDSGADETALAVEYTRLFDVGGGDSLVSLYGGHHHGGRTTAMEEVLRFYHHFGLQLDKARNELPDHLLGELEFLHFMTFQEAGIEARGQDASHYQRGQKDFIERQIGRWFPELRGKLQDQQPLRYYSVLFELLGRFLQHEQQRLSPIVVRAAD